MTQRFVSYKTSPAMVPGEPGAVVRRAGDRFELVNLLWGFEPARLGGRPFTQVRSEGRSVRDRRCLVPASEFFVSSGAGRSRRKWRFALVDGDSFYFAGLWRPARHDWPASYAVLTIAAGPDVAPYHERQMAVVPRRDCKSWFDHGRPEDALLKPLPLGSFHVEQVAGPPAEQPLFDWGRETKPAPRLSPG